MKANAARDMFSEEKLAKRIEKIEKEVEKHGKVSVLVVLGEQASWGIKAGIEDLKWLMTHMKQINKIAIVTDNKIYKWLITLDSPFARMVGIGEKHFDPSQIEDAWKWIKE